jgi:serine phosphatase RsbU (regulator of sigma subunit)
VASGDPRPDFLVPLVLAPEDPLGARLIATPRATRVNQLSLSSPALRTIEATGAELVVPLVEQTELLGLLNLGPRRSGRAYSRDDRRLLDALATHASAALRVAELVQEQRRDARERGRIEQELQTAREIQQSFLPGATPWPAGWDVATYYQPARHVGGDFYDFLNLPGDRFAIVVGDVTGTGVPAALVMAATRGIARTVARRLASPGAILEEVNRQLCQDAHSKLLVTCLCAILDLPTGRLRYATAGHFPPYHRSADGVDEPAEGDLPLGHDPEIRYEDRDVALAPGDAVLFYTDGVVDARDSRGEHFGCERLAGLVANQCTSAGLVDSVREALAAFTGPESEQEDDMTLVALRRSAAVVAGG